MDSRYKVNFKCVVLTTQEKFNKQYVLSLDEKDFRPPILTLDKSISNGIDTHLIKFLQQLVATSDIELIPQLIDIEIPESSDSEIDIIYGFLIKHTDNINGCYWLEFSLANEAPYTNTILHVIQRL